MLGRSDACCAYLRPLDSASRVAVTLSSVGVLKGECGNALDSQRDQRTDGVAAVGEESLGFPRSRESLCCTAVYTRHQCVYGDDCSMPIDIYSLSGGCSS